MINLVEGRRVLPFSIFEEQSLVQVEDKLYDGSVRGKLEKFNNI